VQHLLHGNPTLGPLAVLIVAIIAFSIVNGRFFSAPNLSLVLAQVTVIAVLALGQTLIILTAGIDLSVGAIAVFSSILMANFATKAGMPGVLALMLGWPAAPRWARSTASWSPGSSCRRSSSRSAR
jgi:fructose transport system permease protein